MSGNLPEALVGEFHQVFIINVAVFVQQVGKGHAAAVAATRVAEEDEITLRCPQLHLIVENRTERGARTAVNVQNSGVFLPGS